MTRRRSEIGNIMGAVGVTAGVLLGSIVYEAEKAYRACDVAFPTPTELLTCVVQYPLTGKGR